MEKVKIKNIFDFQKKSKIKAGDGFKLGEAQYPFYTSSNELTKSINEYLFEDESLIFGTGGLASIHFCNEKFAVSTDCFVIQPKDKKRVFSKFVYYYLSGNMNILENGFKGAGLKHISKDYLENIEIPLPNLATQQRIAAILDQADAIIQNNRAIVQKYDALTQSLFLEMFGDIKSNSKNWDLKPFEYFAKFDTKMTSDFEKYADKPHIGIANIEKETGKLVDYKLISEENLSSGKYIFDESHIIYSKIRPNLNKVALPNFSGLCSADSYPLKVISKNTNRIFFAYVLRSDSFVDFILTHSTRTNIPKANKEQMKKYIGIAPPIELQNQFAERVAMIEAQKQQAQLELAKSEELFQSLLQRAFKGELS